MWNEHYALISDSLALAAVALVGYLCGRRGRGPRNDSRSPAMVREVDQAARIADQLQQTTRVVRGELAAFRTSIGGFQRLLAQLDDDPTDASWNRLRQEAERLLGPTMKLGADLSAAYDMLRKQTDQLASFVGARMDPTTGVHNRKALEEQLNQLLSEDPENCRHAALGLFSLTPAVTHGDLGENSAEIVALAQVIDRCARNTDFVARYARDEFVVLMPYASLSGAAALSDRVLQQARQELGFGVWGGVVATAPHDVPQRLLARAEAALYSARTQAEPCLYLHDGTRIRRRFASGPAAGPAPSAAGSSEPETRECPGRGSAAELAPAAATAPAQNALTPVGLLN